jgi:hypothetical protein
LAAGGNGIRSRESLTAVNEDEEEKQVPESQKEQEMHEANSM